MGLDSVELVIAMEEEFAIDIPDTLASNAVTVGQLYELVFWCTRQQTTTKCRKCDYPMFGLPEARCPECGRQYTMPEAIDVWNRVVTVVEEQLGVDRDRISAESHLIRDFGID